MRMRKTTFILILILTFVMSGFFGNDVYAGTSSSKSSTSTSKSSSSSTKSSTSSKAGEGFKSGSFSTTKPSGSTTTKPTAPTTPKPTTPTAPTTPTTPKPTTPTSPTPSKPVENRTYNTYNYNDRSSSSDGFWSGMFFGAMLADDDDDHRDYSSNGSNTTSTPASTGQSSVGKAIGIFFTAIAVICVIAIIVYKVREYIKRRRRL